MRSPAAAALLTTALAGAGGALPAADLAEVKARGTLRVLAVMQNQDTAFISARKGVGMDREILEGFCALHRVRLEVVPLESWGALIPALQEGKGDLIAGRFNVTPSRQEVIDFTAEVFPSRHIVLTRRPHKGVATIEELKAETVGTVRGTSMAEVVEAAGIPPESVDDEVPTGTLPDALRTGRVTAVVLGVENAMVEQRKDPALQLGTFVGPPSSLAYGVRKEDAALRAALDEYIGNVRKSPTWSRLVVKYFGDSAVELLRKARSDGE